GGSGGGGFGGAAAGIRLGWTDTKDTQGRAGEDLDDGGMRQAGTELWQQGDGAEGEAAKERDGQGAEAKPSPEWVALGCAGVGRPLFRGRNMLRQRIKRRGVERGGHDSGQGERRVDGDNNRLRTRRHIHNLCVALDRLMAGEVEAWLGAPVPIHSHIESGDGGDASPC